MARLGTSKALLGRHEYGSALEDLERVKALEPWNAEAEAVEARVRAARRRGRGVPAGFLDAA